VGLISQTGLQMNYDQKRLEVSNFFISVHQTVTKDFTQFGPRSANRAQALASRRIVKVKIQDHNSAILDLLTATTATNKPVRIVSILYH